ISSSIHQRKLPTFLSSLTPRPTATLFPYTTLFRSSPRGRLASQSAARLAKSCEGRSTRRSTGRKSPHTCRGSRASSALRRSSTRSEEHTSELQSLRHLVCRLLLEKKNSRTTHDLHI